MSEMSNEEYPIRPGERLTVFGASESKLAKRNQTKKARMSNDVRVLELEQENKKLIEKMNNYQKIIAKESEMASKELVRQPIEVTQSVSKFADLPIQFDTVSTIAEFQSVRDLLERIATLQIRNDDLIHEVKGWEMRFLRMKMKYQELKQSRELFAGLINTSKQMAAAVQEFKHTKSISRNLSEVIDLQEFNDMIAKFENQIKEDHKKMTEDPKTVMNMVKIDRKDLEVTDKIIKSLQEELEVVKTSLALEKQKNKEIHGSQLENGIENNKNALDGKTEDLLKNVDSMLKKIAIENEKEKQEMLKSFVNKKEERKTDGKKDSVLFKIKDEKKTEESVAEKLMRESIAKSMVENMIGETKAKSIMERKIEETIVKSILENKIGESIAKSMVENNIGETIANSMVENKIEETIVKSILGNKIGESIAKSMVENNIGENAKEFEDLRKNLDKTKSKLEQTERELALMKKKQVDTHRKLEECQLNAIETKNKLEVLSREGILADGKLNELKSDLKTTQEKLKESQNQLLQTQQELEQTKKEKNTLNKKLTDATNETEALVLNIKKTQQQLDFEKGVSKDLQFHWDETEKQREKTQKKLDKTENDLEVTQKKLDEAEIQIKELSNQNSLAKEELEKTIELSEDLKKQLQENVSRKEELQRTLEDNELRRNELKIKLEHSLKQEESLQKKLNETNKKLEKCEAENSKLKKQVLEIQTTANNLKNHLNDMKVVLDEKNTTLSLIQDQQKNFAKELSEGMLKESVLTKSMFESVLQSDEKSSSDSQPKTNEVFELKETLKQAYNKLNELNLMAANVALSNKTEQGLKERISEKLKKTEENLESQKIKNENLEKEKLVLQQRISDSEKNIIELEEELKKQNEENKTLNEEFKNFKTEAIRIENDWIKETKTIKELLNNQIDALTDELKNEKNEKNHLEKLVKKMESDFSEMEYDLNEKTKKIEEKLQNHIQELNTEIENEKSEKEKLNSELRELNNKQNETERELNEKIKTISKMEKLTEELNEELNKGKEEREKMDSELLKLKNNLFEKETEIAEKTGLISQLERDLESLKEDSKKEREEKVAVARELESVKSKYQQAESELKSKIDKLTNELEEIKDELANEKEERNKADLESEKFKKEVQQKEEEMAERAKVLTDKFTIETDDLKEQLIQKEKDIENNNLKYTQEMSEMSQLLNQVKDNLRKSREDKLKMENELSQKQSELNSKQSELNSKNEEIDKKMEEFKKTVADKIKNLEDENLKISEEVKSLKVKNEKLKENVKTQKAEKDKIEEEFTLYRTNEKQIISDDKIGLTNFENLVRDLKNSLKTKDEELEKNENQITLLETSLEEERKKTSDLTHYLQTEKEETARLEKKVNQLNLQSEASKTNFQSLEKQLRESKNNFEKQQQEMEDKVDGLKDSLKQTQNQLVQKGLEEELMSKKIDKLRREYQTLNEDFDLMSKNLEECKIDLLISRKNEAVFNEVKKKLFDEVDRERKRSSQLEIALRVEKVAKKTKDKSKEEQLKQSAVNLNKSSLIDASTIASLPNEYQMNNLRNKIEEGKLQLELREKELENAKLSLQVENSKNEKLRLEIDNLNLQIAELEVYKEKYELTIPLLKHAEELKNQNQEILDLKSQVEKELATANDDLRKMHLEFNEYKIKVHANDKTELISNLESNNKKLTENLQKHEKESQKLTADLKRLEKDLEQEQNKLKRVIQEKERLGEKMKEIEGAAINSRVRKYGLDHEFQTHVQNNQRLKEANDDLQLKYNREVLKNEHLESKCSDLQSQLKSVSKDTFELKKMEANVVLKNQQIFDMLANSNSKQTELDSLKNKVVLLENRLKIVIQKATKASVQLAEDEVISAKLEELREKLNIQPENFRSLKEELATAYTRVSQLTEERSERMTLGGTERKRPTYDDELERKIENLEKEVQSSLQRESEFREIARKMEEKATRSESLYQESQKSFLEKVFRIQELETCKTQNEFKISKLATEIREQQRQLIEKEKDLIKTKVTVNRMETETHSNGVLAQIAQSKLEEIGDQKQQLLRRLQDRENEINAVSDESYRAFHELLNQHNEEKESHEVTKKDLEKALSRLSKAEKQTTEVGMQLSLRTDEVAKTKLEIANLTDRIELLTRVSKLTQEELKDVVRLGDAKLENAFLEKRLKETSKRADELQDDLDEKTKQLDNAAVDLKMARNETRTLKNEIESLETELNKTRNKVIQKNNAIGKLQDEYLMMKLERDREQTDAMLTKIKNSEAENRMSFMMKQITLFDVKNRAHLSLNELGTQTEETENEIVDDEFPDTKMQADALKLLREFRMKMKVKNDQIAQLTENFELLEKQVSEEGRIKRVGRHFMNEEDWRADQKEKKHIQELESKIEHLQSQIRGKEVFENELMELIEQRRAFEGFKNQMNELLREESNNNKMRADQSVRDLFKSQVTVSEYVLQVNKLREEKKQMEKTYQDREEVIKKMEIDIMYLERVASENKSKAERMEVQAEINSRLENEEKKRLKDEIVGHKRQIKQLEELIEKDLKGAELKNEVDVLKGVEVQHLETKNQQLVDKFAAQKHLSADNETLKKENWSLKSKLDNSVKEMAYLKQRVPELESELASSKQNAIDQEHKTSLIALQLERTKLQHANELEITIENHKKEMENLNSTILNQREILKRNYKIYASKVNMCNREIKDLKAQLKPDEPVDYEQELRTSLLLEELFEKEHEMVRIGSTKKIEREKSETGPTEAVSEKPKFTSKLLKALEEDMKSQSIREEDNEDAGSVELDDDVEKLREHRRDESSEIVNFKKKNTGFEVN